MANTAFDHASALTLPGSTTNNGLVRWGDTSAGSFGNITGITSDGSNITLLTRGEIRFSDADSSHFIAFESPATVGTSYTMTLPAAVPSAADYLKVTSYSGGAGVLEWASVSADTNTTYSTSWVDSTDDAILRLTPSTGSADDLTIVAGSGITLTPSGDNLTIAAAGGAADDYFASSGLSSKDQGTGLHIKTGDSGGTASSAGNEFIIEGGSGNHGMSILGSGDGGSYIYLGDGAAPSRAGMSYSHGDDQLVLRSGDNTRMAISSSGAFDFYNGTLSNVGDAGNDWTANSVTLQHDADNVQMTFKLYNTSSSGTGSAAFKTRCYAGTGDPLIECEITGGGQFLMGIDNSNSDLFTLGGHGSGLGSNDTFRVTQGTPPVLSLNTGLGSNFDYVCSNCGNHGLEMFACCGEVEWHDDVLALRKAGVDLATMANPYAIGQSLNIAHLVKLGIMNYDDKEEDLVALANRKTPWLGINISNGLMFTWAGMWQTRERMDNQYQELKDTIQELKAEVAALRGQ